LRRGEGGGGGGGGGGEEEGVIQARECEVRVERVLRVSV
jgi:hypothetical protein